MPVFNRTMRRGGKKIPSNGRDASPFAPVNKNAFCPRVPVYAANIMIQEIPYAGWKRNLRIQGQTTELIITLDVGPRIIRYAFHDDKNVFVELPGANGRRG